ncbi:MAG TPA: response regulator [Nitrospiraceae bacterium]|nr:response regulator [Nitrospiraceae bacterium]
MTTDRILVVDDNEAIRQNVGRTLEQGGFQVLSAGSGSEAIALMAQSDNASTVSALLCDLKMPNGSGTETILHFHSRYPAIPIVVFSGAEASMYLDAISHQAVSDWLRKPATRDAILEKIRCAVHLHALRKKELRQS